MEDEKLDNAAFYPNSSAVPREIDKAASAPNDSIEPAAAADHSCSPAEHSMDTNLNVNLNVTLNEAATIKRSESELAGHLNSSSTECPPDDDPNEAGSTKSRSNSDDNNNKNLTSLSNENSVKLRPDASEVNNKNVQANDRTVKQEVNGFPSKPTIMSNGTKLKRNDDQLNETSSEGSNSTKKICNNSTKTTPVHSSSAANSNGKLRKTCWSNNPS